jgi:hypothetical protein
MPNGLRAIAGVVVLVAWLTPLADGSASFPSAQMSSEAGAASALGIARATPDPVPNGNERPRQPIGATEVVPSEVANLLIGVVGALVGAIVTYVFAVRQREQDIATRSNVHTTALSDELNDIEGVLPSYAPGAIFYRDPIRLSALPHLLEGSTLNSRTDGELIGLLISLHTATSTYNDFASSFNLAQVTGHIPPESRAQMYHDLAQRHQRVVQHKKALIDYFESRSLSRTRHEGQWTRRA